jgi:hypothetical protein
VLYRRYRIIKTRTARVAVLPPLPDHQDTHSQEWLCYRRYRIRKTFGTLAS